MSLVILGIGVLIGILNTLVLVLLAYWLSRQPFFKEIVEDVELELKGKAEIFKKPSETEENLAKPREDIKLQDYGN